MKPGFHLIGNHLKPGAFKAVGQLEPPRLGGGGGGARGALGAERQVQVLQLRRRVAVHKLNLKANFEN
jgi:hypothetical protein